MKEKIILIALAVSLMSTKCAEKSLNMTFSNESENNVVFSSTNNRNVLKEIMLKKNSHDPRFKYIRKGETNNDTLTVSSLDFYLSKDRDFYTFYFFQIKQFDTIKDLYVFEKKYDSININKQKFQIGMEGKNILIYNDKRILFKSYVND